MTEKPIVLELRNVTKQFDRTQVLRGVSLSVREGEFVTILGPSGSGKTTILRIIAGLEEPDGGQVLLEGEDMNGRPPEKRNVNTVFQNYALFPHLDVYHNIAYGLKIRKIKKAEIRRRVTEMLSLVQLEGFEKRMPGQMSGGQRQRVAIARALIGNPRVLLLDEPLGALDLQLRRQMQHELKRLQKKLGITFIYITHDQEEAINMSDTIVVMHDGTFEQVGTPAEIYDRPRTSYVASFVGAANILCGTVEAVETDPDCPRAVLKTEGGTFFCRLGEVPAQKGQKKTIAVRSENIRIGTAAQSSCFLTGKVQEKNFAGGMLHIAVQLPDKTELTISRQGIDIEYELGEQVFLEWEAEKAVFVDENG